MDYLSSNSQGPREETRSQGQTPSRRRHGAVVAESSEVTEKEGSNLEERDILPYPTGDQEIPKTVL
jgi:hypothetical protein